MNEPKENPSSFKDSIGLNTEMTPNDAIEKLASFHGATKEAILRAFMYLWGFEGTIEFKEGLNGGNPCIIMEGKNQKGRWAWNHLINEHTGQPQRRRSC